MRSEKQMMDLILDIANNDDRIRAVYMNGSRTNANVPKDIFQDYDIMYVVTETKSFREDKKWIDCFGERLYMQYPDDGVFSRSDKENCYGWLIQFADGNRLDLHVETISNMNNNILSDKLCLILLDKDNILPKIPKATDEGYWINRPIDQEFQWTCNEFWWCFNNVAKGLWRKEILYVMDMINFYIRPMLIRLLEWKAGMDNHFSVSAGKSGKYLYRWLSEDTWGKLLQTYPKGNIEDIWDSVFIMCELFDNIAKGLSIDFNYKYDTEEANNSFRFLKDIKILPEDADKIY